MKLLLLLFTGAKFGKLFLTGGTILLSVFAYALLFGWRYAVGFVVLLFVHEMGHYIAARHRGLDVGAPTFIPFVGAWIQLKDMPHDAETEALSAWAGHCWAPSARWSATSSRATRAAICCWRLPIPAFCSTCST